MFLHIDGEKDILSLWLNESESYTWMQIFDELKTQSAEDVLFIGMDCVSWLYFFLTVINEVFFPF